MYTTSIAALVLSLVVVGGSPALGAPQASSPAAEAAQKAVDLNTASAAELETLPGIGPALAARIIEYREENGPFEKIEELMNVRGIGEKAFLNLRAQITVVPPAADR